MPQCVVCMKTLSNASIEPSLLQRHLQTNHPDKKARDPNYFKRLGENAKKQRLDKMDKQYQQSVGIVTASYKTALLVAKNKQPHTIAEELIMPAAKVLVKLVIGDEAMSKLYSVLVSSNTIQRCITEMSTDIKEQVITEVLGSKYGFAIQPTCQTTRSLWSMCVIPFETPGIYISRRFFKTFCWYKCFA